MFRLCRGYRCEQGGEVCALENELSLDARRKRAAIAAQLDTSKEGENHEHPREPGIGENFDVPVVLLTLGWDPAGDPTHGERGFGRDNSCALRVADIPRVLRWFTSHTRHDSRRHEKVSSPEPFAWMRELYWSLSLAQRAPLPRLDVLQGCRSISCRCHWVGWFGAICKRLIVSGDALVAYVG